MTKSAPGKHYRDGLTMAQAVRLFSDEAEIERMFIEVRWPNGIACPLCGSLNAIERPTTPASFRCRDCKSNFSIKTGTVMQSSKLPLTMWALGFYLFAVNLKGVSSMRLHRELGITQKSAWHMAHRIRKAWEKNHSEFEGPVEVDETYVGGGGQQAQEQAPESRTRACWQDSCDWRQGPQDEPGSGPSSRVREQAHYDRFRG